jgi:RNA polymerase sigma-70 factor (subfamily 1)
MSTHSSSLPPERFTVLLAQSRQGDSQAMGELLEIHREYLVSLAGHLIPNRVCGRIGAADAVQAAVLSAYEHFETFRGDLLDALCEWLRTILLNTIREFVRTAHGRRGSHVNREVALDDVSTQTTSPFCRDSSIGERLRGQERTACIQRCFESLPEAYREVLRLRFDDGLRFAEVGKTLEISTEAARKRAERALETMRDLLLAAGITDEGI